MIRKLTVIFTVLSVLALLTAGCVSLSVSSYGVEGKGEIKTMEYTAGDFNRIRIGNDISGSVYYTVGEEKTVKIEAHENHLPLISVENAGGELDINSSEQLSPAGRDKKDGFTGDRTYPKIYITAPTLEGVKIFGSTRFDSPDEIVSDTFELKVYGAADADFLLKVKTLEVNVDGASSITLNGSADTAVIENSGVGSIEAFGLTTADAEVSLQGVGSIEITCDNKLDAEVNGVGSIVYQGDPEVTKSTSGLGSITKK